MQNTYNIGERVAINLNIDQYKTTDKVMFGKVIQCILDDSKKNREIYIHPVLTIVQGDNDELYQGISFSPAVCSRDHFMNKAEFIDAINMREAELQEEVRIYKEFENLYMEELTNRQTYGGDMDYIIDKYKTFIAGMVERINDEYNSIKYLAETYMELFDHRPINGTIYEERFKIENNRKDGDNK